MKVKMPPSHCLGWEMWLISYSPGSGCAEKSCPGLNCKSSRATKVCGHTASKGLFDKVSILIERESGVQTPRAGTFG